MSQHDFNIANQGFPATRADLNNALAALASTSSGDTEPSTTYANQLWYDTSNNLLKFRNEADSAWITFAYLDQASNEWEIRSAVIQAVDSAGVVVKTDDGTTRLTVADDGSVTFANDVTVTGTISASNVPSVGAFSNRNKIINGAMVIDQRNNGSAVTTSFQYSVDRFLPINNVTSATFSAQQDSLAPAGFTKSLKYTVTASGTPTSGEQANIRHYIEGFNTADLNWGTSNAQSVTLSFWVRSSLTGTFGGAISNAAFDRAYAYSYSIDAADTWEYKSVTISGDTTGTWETGSSAGIRIYWGLGADDLKKTAGVWDGTFATQSTGSVDLISTLNATFYLTGVQLEVGDGLATPFEHRSFSNELHRCQRYYQRISGTYGGTQGLGTGFGSSNTVTTVDIFPPVKELLRDQSAVSFSAASLFTINTNAISANATNISAATYSNNHVRVQITATSDSSTLSSARLVRFNSVNAFVDWDSEL